MTDYFVAVVRDGALKPLGMPRYGDVFSDEEIAAIKMFIEQRAALTLAPPAGN